MSKQNNEFNWTDRVTLQTYFERLMEELIKSNERRFEEVEEKMDMRFKMNQIAIDKAETAVNIRLENMNEFRNSLKDQAVSFMTKSDYDTKHQLLVDKIDSVQKITYMLIGGLAVVEFIFKFFIK